jgi:hypothetical protein
MRRVTTVTLRRDQLPIFPDRCAFSGLPNQGETVGFLTRDGLRGHALWAGWYATRVPCRPDLKWRVHAAQACRFSRTVLVGFGSMALSAYVIYPILKDFWLGLASLGITVICIAGLVWWEMTHPPVFNISAHEGAVDFEFLDVAYAEQFARLNNAPIELQSE